jgi:competence protein ComEC
MPDAFNYRAFMRYHGVYDRVYLSANQWMKTKRKAGNPVIAFSIYLQGSILQTLAGQGLTGDELAISSAILAGHREGLDMDLQDRFAGAGAMHILCVSGLHVGVIYLVLSTLLEFMGKSKQPRLIRGILLLAAIWQYALVTGCAPSVLRASSMISFLLMARLLNRNPNIYNSLAASAFLLLLSDPMIIMSVGFQLSYMAVLGIVSVQPMLYRLLYLKYWLFDKAWAIISVSIAAQAGTFPLAIYYFHQFPNYFILTNLIVIPASSIIIYFGFLLLLATPFPWLAEIIAFLLGKSIYLMNECITIISSMPVAVSRDLFLSRAESVVIYLLLLSFLLLLGHRKRRYIWPAMLSLILIIISINIRKDKNSRQQIFIVHAVGEQAYEFIMGSKHCIFLDTADTHLRSDVIYQSSNYWVRHGLRQADHRDIRSLGGDTLISGQIFLYQHFVRFGSKRILFLESDIPADTTFFLPGEWIVVLSEKARPNIGLLNRAFDLNMLVFDGSTRPWQVPDWKKSCDSLGLPYHDVNEEGAFICNLR